MSKKKQVLFSKKHILIDDKTQSVASEAFKSVRTNLLSILSTYENHAYSKILCFTSPELGEGSTLNCVNIAVSFAKMGAKVLLIDTDMRQSKVHEFFDIPAAPGLSEYLAGSSTIQQAVVSYSDIANLSILPSGAIPPNPTELILSTQFNDLLNLAQKEYDYVFIDTPPVCSVTDAAIISNKTLGAILICKSGHTKSDVAKKAKHIIEQAGGKIIGTILNGVSSK